MALALILAFGTFWVLFFIICGFLQGVYKKSIDGAPVVAKNTESLVIKLASYVARTLKKIFLYVLFFIFFVFVLILAYSWLAK